MNTIARWLYESIADTFEFPVRFTRTLAENPDIRMLIEEPPKVVAARSVVEWNAWYSHRLYERYSKTTLHGRCKVAGFGYTGTTIEVPELAELVKCEVIENWDCEIREIDGLSASKGPIEKVEGMDNFAEQHCKSFIDEISEEKLLKNLAHDEIRIIHNKNTCDHFACYEWDGRTFLMNSGGSHHFAAARYIAGKLDRPVNLQGKLYRYRLNPIALDLLRRKFDIFVIKIDSAYGKLYDPLSAFQASFFTLDLPRPYEGVNAIFLPRTERRSMRVADAFRNAKYFDLGEHLTEIADRQV